MIVKDLIEKLNSMVINGICEENTEFVFFADNGDGTACMMDSLELGLNGNFVQLFMRRDD